MYNILVREIKVEAVQKGMKEHERKEIFKEEKRERTSMAKVIKKGMKENKEVDKDFIISWDPEDSDLDGEYFEEHEEEKADMGIIIITDSDDSENEERVNKRTKEENINVKYFEDGK